MPLYKQNNAAELAQSAMSGATQAMAAQTKETGTRTEKESNFWDDLNKGAAAVAYVGRGLDGLTKAADGAWNMYDKYKLRDAYDSVDKAYSEGGIDAIQNNPNMQDYWHSKAFGQFMLDRASNEKGRLEMMQNMDAAADKMYQDWRIQAMGVRQAYTSGDTQKFMPMMQQLSTNSPLPYKLEPTNDGNFKVLFRSDEKGGWADTGRTMTQQEAMGEVDNVLRGEQSMLRGVDGKTVPVNLAFNKAAVRSYWLTQIGNAENRTDPKRQIPLYNSEGKPTGIGIVQNPLDDYSVGPKLLVYGNGGRQIGTFDGYDGAMKAGYIPFAPPKGKGSAKGGAAGEGGGYSLSQGDIHMLQGYATTKNEMGEKEVDHGTAAFLEQFVRDKGLSPLQAISVFDENVKRAVAAGAPPEQARRIVMTEMAKGMRVGQRGQSPQHGQSEQSPQQSPSQPQQQTPKAQGRIQEVLGLGLQGNQQDVQNGGSGGAPATLSGNYRDNLARQENTRRSLAESGDYPTEIVGLPGLGINGGALVEGDNVRGQGMLSGIGLRPSPFGQTESQKWRQHFNR